METILNPLSRESAVFVTGYPLTREELRILAAHWATVYIEASADATLMNSVGSTDLRLFEYVAARHRLMEPILGDAAMRKAVREAEARVRGRIGDDLYAAYLQGESPIGDRWETEGAEREPTPRETCSCAVCGEDVAAEDEEPTFCGSVHARCLPAHVAGCGVCCSHPPLARKIGTVDIMSWKVGAGRTPYGLD